ncbi:MAG: hypothetical protein H6765_02590 [Candidatus Peribacteria bacterium]|nr:MAG: hypothetical protein H6765_02590 [Candidatus Peribacteria bacterium]
MDIYQTLKIRSDVDESSTQILTQDVILSATFFIGTMVAVGLLISGFMMVFGGADEAMYQR